jgi:hypothetical protein
MADAIHPLNRGDAERSKARVADVELGLTHALDHSYWRDLAERRVTALEEDRETFGLVPHEEAELETLKALLEKDRAHG